jgi:rare lipoprotein A (peptidoglycan hydrolase)
VRLPRVVAVLALIAGLALVAVPGPAGSYTPEGDSRIDPARFRPVAIANTFAGTTTTTLDPAHRSDGALDTDATLLEPAHAPEPAGRAVVQQPAAPTGVIVVPIWKYDPNVSFYGPGFYGRRTACGHAYTTTIMGVAHRTLPCGTRVTFRNPANGRTITVPVIDRGPYVAGRQWDLSGAACRALNHCYTGGIYWRFP